MYVQGDTDETGQGIGFVPAVAAGSGLTAGLIGAERVRRQSASQKIPLGEALRRVASDARSDVDGAIRVLSGATPYDRLEKEIKENPGAGLLSAGSIRKYSQNQPSNRKYFAPEQSPAGYVSNPLTQSAVAARDAFVPSSEDFLGFRRENRLERGVSPEGPKSDTVFTRIPSLDAARDLMPERFGGFAEAEREARKKAGISLMKGNSAQALGGLAGRAASDFVNNGARSVWWLLNAPQAVSDVVSEGIAGLANREGLYGLDYGLKNNAQIQNWVDGQGTPINPAVNPVRYDMDKPERNDAQVRRRVDDLRRVGQSGDEVFSRRRVGNNLSTLLALPASIAINSGLGLTNLTGGSEGRKAVFASEDDPTKSSNAVAEVAAKYFLGRQGDLLPWEEFKKVRPDVTQDEFRAYKAYRFNKAEDWNPTDGDLNIANGILKYNDDGIDGSEVMFLGRSMPIATTILPTAAAIAGAGLGAAVAKHGGLNIDGVRDGIARRQTELDGLNKEVGYLSGESSDPATRAKQIRANKLEKEIDQKRRQQVGMQRGPASGFFNNRRVRNSGVIASGLIGSSLAMVGGSLIGDEIERRRRAEKIQDQSSEELNRNFT